MTFHSQNFIGGAILSIFVSIFTASWSVGISRDPSHPGKSQNSTGHNGGPAASELRQGACAFQSRDYVTAQQHFEKALGLDPTLEKVPLYIAEALNAQLDQKPAEDERQRIIAAYEKLIAAYEQMIGRNPNNSDVKDRALAFKANIYERLTKAAEENGGEGKQKAAEYRQKYYEILEARASLPGAKDEIKAVIYYTIGQSYWSVAFKLSRQYINYDGTLKQPIPPDRVEQMRPAIEKALEYLNKALQYNPDYADAWTIKKLALLQQSFITTDPAQKQAIMKEADAVSEKAGELYKKRRQEAARGDLVSLTEMTTTTTGKERGEAGGKNPLEEVSDFVRTGYYKQEAKVDLDRLIRGTDLVRVPPPLPPPAPPPPSVEQSEEQAKLAKEEAEAQAELMNNLSLKSFSPANEEFSVLMPSPVSTSVRGSGNFYDSHSEGVQYFILSQPAPSLPPGTATDSIDYLLASQALGAARGADILKRPEDEFEVSLVGKLSLNNYPGLDYGIRWTEYCGKIHVGVLRVYLTDKHIYTLLVTAAEEADLRAGRFLQSFTIRPKRY